VKEQTDSPVTPKASHPYRKWAPGVLSFVIYSALAMLVFGHFSELGPGHISGDGSIDAILQIWWLAWVAFALPHGLNVFSTHWINYPAGANFGVIGGSALALGVVLLPITKLLGPAVAWNIAVRLALVVSATSMCLVLRRWTTWWPAAFLGGLLYGFSAYAFYNGGNGAYLFLIFVPLPPLIFLILHEILVRQQWRPRTAGILLAAVCAVQFFISTEVLASTVVMGAIATGIYLVIARHEFSERWAYAATAFAYGLGVALLLLAYPAWVTFAGPQHLHGSLFSPAQLALLPSDLYGAVISNGEWLHVFSMPSPSAFYPISVAESSQMYLGLPLILVLGCFVALFRKRQVVLFAGWMAVIAFVLSLGSPLWVDGHRTSIALPFAVFDHIPALEGFLAARFALFTIMFGAAIFAMGLDELWGLLRVRLNNELALVFIGVLSAVVAIPLIPAHAHPSTPVATPSVFTSTFIPAGSVVLAYPYPDVNSQQVMLDQAIGGIRFKLIGGYGSFPSSTGRYGTTSPAALRPRAVQELFDAAFSGSPPPAGDLAPAIRSFLRRYGVQVVAVVSTGDNPGLVVDRLTAAIGPPVHVGESAVWLHVQRQIQSSN
jgi:hypothetical protein